MIKSLKYICFYLCFMSLWASQASFCPFESYALQLFPQKSNQHFQPRIGEVIDRFNNVEVYYNGDVGNVFGRNVTYDGYNLGLNYQCVEYIKRYYYYVYDHKMPNSYGHAKEFFNPKLPDRKYNPKRDLYQFTNGSEYRPLPGDIIVFDSTHKNPFGHAGIVTYSKGDRCEIIQQNVGQKSREMLGVMERQGKFFVLDKDVLGWLRKG